MFKAIFVAGLAALAAAQSNSLSFNSVPTPAKAGQQETITYRASDLNTPVTILLRKGPSGNLQTVSTLTSSATGGSYSWTPASDLADGSDYALQITQGSESNYYGPFSISGGSGSASSSASSMSASSSGLPVPAGNSTLITTTSCPPTGNATVPATVPASMGTGASMPRNTTMAKPTLSSTGVASSASAGSTNTNGAGFQGSSTGSARPTNSNSAAVMTTGSSVAALVLSGVAAFFFA